MRLYLEINGCNPIAYTLSFLYSEALFALLVTSNNSNTVDNDKYNSIYHCNVKV